MNSQGSLLGESLVAKGRLTTEQLQRALENQRLVGGRLGTSLVELGLAREDTVLEALGRLRSTHTAAAADLARISPAVLRSIPDKLARRYRLVPYQVRGKTLMVASMDPGDALREDEISFLTGFMVRTCVALELRVHIALRQHFGVPLDPRFLPIARRLLRGSRSGTAARPSSAPAATTSPAAARTIPTPWTDTTGRPSAPSPSYGGVASPPAAPSSPPVLPTPGRQSPTPSSADGAVDRSSGIPEMRQQDSAPHQQEVAPHQQEVPPRPAMEFIELDAADLAALRGPAAGGEVAVAGEPRAVADPMAMPTPPPPPTGVGAGVAEDDLVFEPHAEDSTLEGRLDRAAHGLMAAEIRDDIGEALLDFAGHYFRRTLLLVARKGELVGWMGAGEGMVDARIRAIGIDARSPSVFLGLQQPSSFWLGPLPPLPANRAVIEGLGGVAPRDCLALPVILRSKVVCHLYADNLEKGVAGAPVAELKRLVGMAGLAFEVYILKNKIRGFGATGRGDSSP